MKGLKAWAMLARDVGIHRFPLDIPFISLRSIIRQLQEAMDKLDQEREGMVKELEKLKQNCPYCSHVSPAKVNEGHLEVV